MEEHKGLPIIEFPDAEAWERWLHDHHADSPGIWLKLGKRSARPQAPATCTYAQALEVAICFGWIDGQKGAYDDAFFLQRFTPRRPRSKWSQVNRDKAEKLIDERRMRPAGQAQVDQAKRDGRWEAAYEPQSRATIAPDFQAALDQHPQAREFFATLTGATRYAFLYRLHNVKRPEARARRITGYIELLSAGKTLHDR